MGVGVGVGEGVGVGVGEGVGEGVGRASGNIFVRVDRVDAETRGELEGERRGGWYFVEDGGLGLGGLVEGAGGVEDGEDEVVGFGLGLEGEYKGGSYGFCGLAGFGTVGAGGTSVDFTGIAVGEDFICEEVFFEFLLDDICGKCDI